MSPEQMRQQMQNITPLQKLQMQQMGITPAMVCRRG